MADITGKSVGKNVIVVIDGVKYSRAFANKEDRQDILDKVADYNAKNTKAKLKSIISLLEADKVAKEEEVKAVKEKSVKAKTVKPVEAATVVPEKSIEEHIMFLLENGYSVTKTQPAPQHGKARSGEY